ncbi:MAG: UPF0149 family protein [Pseudomonadota bacterium]
MMETGRQAVNEVLRVLEATPEGGERVRRARDEALRLLTVPGTAEALVDVIGALEDREATPGSTPATLLLDFIVDEAARARDDRSAGASFLDHLERAIAAPEVSITLPGLQALAAAHIRRRLPLPEALKERREALFPFEPTDDQVREEVAGLRAHLAKFPEARTGAPDPFADLFLEHLSVLPESHQRALIRELIANADDPVWLRIALCWLLAIAPEVREPTVHALVDRSRDRGLPADVATRLPLLRHWLPDPDQREALDEVIQSAMRRGDLAGAMETAPRLAIHDRFASLPDGAGAHYLAFTAADEQGAWTVGMILLKAGRGVRDAFMREGLETGSMRALLDEMATGSDLFPVTAATADTLLSGALAENRANGEPPSPALLSATSLFDLDEPRPQPMEAEQWLELLDPNDQLPNMTPQRYGRLVNRSADWPEPYPVTESWFARDLELFQRLEENLRPRATDRVIREHFEAHRADWAEFCFRAALVLADTPGNDNALTFLATAHALLNGRELKRIPVMREAMDRTLDEFLESPVAEPDATPDAAPTAEPEAPAAPPGFDPIGSTLTAEQEQLLRALFEAESPNTPWDAGYLGLHGYLYAMTLYPEPPLPSEWLPPLLEGAGTDQRDFASAESLLQALFTLYNTINGQVRAGTYARPPECPLDPDPMANFWPHAPVGDWARGFRLAQTHFRRLDEAYVEWLDAPELEEILGRAIMAAEIFGLPERVREMVEDPEAEEGLSVEKLAGMAHELFDDSLASLTRTGSATREAVAEEFAEQEEAGPPPAEPVRVTKIGRNEPCPCGSGRKYKRCCLKR